MGERLAAGAVVEEVPDDLLDVVGEVFGGHLVRAELAPEPGLETQRATEVDLEALDLVAVLVEHEHALESDVGGLDAGTGVGAPVDVDGDRGVELRHPLLELGDELGRALLGLDNGELARSEEHTSELQSLAYLVCRLLLEK